MPGTGATQTVTIGAAGGTIALDSMTLTVPAGALVGDTAISVTSSQNCPWPAEGFTPVTPIYAFAPEGLEFAQPVTIAIGYPGDHHAAIFAFTNDRGDLGDVAADNTQSTLSAQISHLGSAVVGNYQQAIVNPSEPAYFAAVPSSIDPGAHATLDIDSNENFFTSDCSLDEGLGPVKFKQRLSPQQTIIPYAKYDVAPTTTTTYTLLCPTEQLNVVQTVIVNSPPLLTLTADKTTVTAGDIVTLTWAAGHTTFDSCTLNGQTAGPFGGTMQLPATPLSAAATDAIFALECLDQGKHVLERRVKVTVNNTTTCIAAGDVCDPSALDDACCAPTDCDPVQKLCVVPTDGGAPDSGRTGHGRTGHGRTGFWHRRGERRWHHRRQRRRRRGRAMTRALVLVALAACSSGTTKVVVIQQEAGAPDGAVAANDAGLTPTGCIRGSGMSASQTIGHGGGQITLETLVLNIQPEAITTDTKVTVTSSVGCPGDTTLASETPLYEITPAGLPLDVPAGISITYPGGSHGVMLFASTQEGDLGYLATSTDRNEVHGSLAQLGAVWVASWPAVAPFNVAIVPTAIDDGADATLLVTNDEDFSKADCMGAPGLGAPAWNFVFDAAKEDYFPRAAFDITAPGTYAVTCTAAALTASATLAIRPTPELTFTATATELTWSAPAFAKCALDGADFAVAGTEAATTGVHSLVCYDAAGVRVSRWASAPAH